LNLKKSQLTFDSAMS